MSANCITVIQSCVRIEKSEWLARRAELQNKPSWKDAPEWAEWLAQDEDGEWKWLAGLPGKYVDCWTAVKIKGCCKGLALGDWWDTLEKRPEQKAFKPLTSIEDNQEKDMKQDNGWYEREILADLIESHRQMSALDVADAILTTGFLLGEVKNKINLFVD